MRSSGPRPCAAPPDTSANPTTSFPPPSALASAEGFRVIWVRSSHKVVRDADARSERVGAGVAALDDLNQKLLSNRSRLKSLEAVEAAAAKATEDARASRWVGFEVEEYTEVRHRQETRGRPVSTPLSPDHPH